VQPDSDQELELMLADLESGLVEREESWSGDAPEKGRQAICAFADDLPGHARPGVLIVGAKHDAGCMVIQHALRHDRPTKACNKWVERVPRVREQYMLGAPDTSLDRWLPEAQRQRPRGPGAGAAVARRGKPGSSFTSHGRGVRSDWPALRRRARRVGVGSWGRPRIGAGPDPHAQRSNKPLVRPMRALLLTIAVLSSTSLASATTQQYFQRVDAAQVAKARTWLAAGGHTGIVVRSFRGRLTLSGALPSGAARAQLFEGARSATGALSVHAG